MGFDVSSRLVNFSNKSFLTLFKSYFGLIQKHEITEGRKTHTIAEYIADLESLALSSHKPGGFSSVELWDRVDIWVRTFDSRCSCVVSASPNLFSLHV